MDAALASEIMQALRVIVAKPMRKFLDKQSCTDGVNYYMSELWDFTEDTPFELLGAGHFSAAFKHRGYPEYCFKIGFRAEDSGAMYAAWCRDNKIPNIPEIIHMDRWPEAYMVCMPCYLSAYEPPACVVGWDSHNVTGVLRDYLQEDFCLSWTDEETYKALEIESVYATCKRIKSFFEGVAQIDMHIGNWMWDKDGNIIITDPVSFTIKTPDPAAIDKLQEWRDIQPKEAIGKAHIHNPLNTDAIRRFDRVLFTHFMGGFKIPQLFAPGWFPSSKKGFIRNGGKTHVQKLQQREPKKVPGLWSKLLNRI